jgi:hypothetical protein
VSGEKLLAGEVHPGQAVRIERDEEGHALRFRALVPVG